MKITKLGHRDMKRADAVGKMVLIGFSKQGCHKSSIV